MEKELLNKVIKSIGGFNSHKKSEVYLPSFWRFIMLIIKLIPNFVFKKINL